MFWSDTVENTIYQANLNGTDMRVLLNESLEVVGVCSELLPVTTLKIQCLDSVSTVDILCMNVIQC